MLSALSERLSTRKLKGPEQDPVILTRRRIYILPTRYGLYFSALLLLMLIGSINYNNSLGYSLTFLLASMAIISMLHTHRNLSLLTIKRGKVSPVYAGQTAYFPMHISNNGSLACNTIKISSRNSASSLPDLPQGDTATITLNIPTSRRGRLDLERFKIYTEYPFGLFHAWSWVHLSMHCIVYPHPEENPPEPVTAQNTSGEMAQTKGDENDFRGLRNYQAGDSPRRIAWKHYAKREELFTKQFNDSVNETLILDWNNIHGLSAEERLSRLCRWVIDSHKNGYYYGLIIPGKSIEPGHDESHLKECLLSLALYPQQAQS